MSSIFDIPAIGELKIDKVLFESFYPILFTCTNNNKELYLCVCCTRKKHHQIWLLTKTTPAVVINLLENNITMRDAFFAVEHDRYTIISQDNNRIIKINDSEYWDKEQSIYLPTKGEYMDAEEDEFAEEIDYFKKMDCSNLSYNDFQRSILIKKVPVILSVYNNTNLKYNCQNKYLNIDINDTFPIQNYELSDAV